MYWIKSLTIIRIRFIQYNANTQSTVPCQKKNSLLPTIKSHFNRFLTSAVLKPEKNLQSDYPKIARMIGKDCFKTALSIFYNLSEEAHEFKKNRIFSISSFEASVSQRNQNARLEFKRQHLILTIIEWDATNFINYCQMNTSLAGAHLNAELTCSNLNSS